jgi:hypothetical protein
MSLRQLTHKEDRLAALEGLARANVEVTGDRYSLGVFESRILEQLLWSMSKRARTSEDLVDMPHWSWASRGGPKAFWVAFGNKWRQIPHTRAVIESFGILKVDGFVVQSRTSIAKSRKSTRKSGQVFRDLFAALKTDSKNSLHWIQGFSKKARTIGVAAFDRERFPKVHILFLKRWRNYSS